MKKNILILIFGICFNWIYSQSPGLKDYDHVYKDNIKSVRFHVDNVFLSLPLVDLNSSAPLRLSFDDMNEDVMDYIYFIVHCNQDWKPSQLDEIDYLDGFNGERIETYDFSFNTITDYTHYELLLPNEDVRWLVSGNYLIHIFEDTEERAPVLTRRFMVSESVMRISSQIVPPNRVSKYRTHQELDFNVNFKGIRIDNPQREITASVLQNGRWDNAITGLKPQFTRSEDMIFDYQDKIIFPAGKEFRFLDIRTFRTRREMIADIIRMDTYFDVVVAQDKSRASQHYQSYNDINGEFLIENLERRRPDLEGDYAKVLFALGVNQPLPDDVEVYIVGKMTDWELKEAFKMTYNPAINSYVTQPFLKQGYYDYIYVTTSDDKKTMDLEEFEGNWHQTENNYTILVYYRPFGALYDRLVAVQTINSLNNN